MQATRLAAALAGGCISLSSMAITFNDMTDAEVRTLPQWCAHTQTFPREIGAPDHYNLYLARYGVGWTHVHHYCWALGSMVRHNQPGSTPQEKTGLVASAIADLDYVLRNSPKDFLLRFEISVRKARLLQMSGALQPALELANAIAQEWPDRADSYGLLAEVHLSMRKPGEARKVLEGASARVEDADRLQKIRAVLKL